jgi:hypothetical protein
MAVLKERGTSRCFLNRDDREQFMFSGETVISRFMVKISYTNQ